MTMQWSISPGKIMHTITHKYPPTFLTNSGDDLYPAFLEVISKFPQFQIFLEDDAYDIHGNLVRYLFAVHSHDIQAARKGNYYEEVTQTAQ